MAENHLHSVNESLPGVHDLQSDRPIGDSMRVILKNTHRQICLMLNELALTAGANGISESSVHFLLEIQSASENLLDAMAAIEVTLPESHPRSTYTPPSQGEEISLGQPVPCPVLSEHQETELTHFLAEFGPSR